MKIRADEHVSQRIVGAIRTMALSTPFELSSVVECGDRGKSDVHWIRRFASEGGKAILSGDADFFSRPHQVMAVCECGMMIVHMPARWSNAKCHLQAAHLLMWWSRIEAALSTGRPRQCFRPGWNIAEKGEMVRIKVDYEAARKKIKKAARESRVSEKSYGRRR